VLHEASYYLKMAAGLAQYQLSPKRESPVELLRDQMQHREERFLEMAKYVLDQPAHVYRKLFDLAGCSYADLESGVRRNGLRETLPRLLEAGIYITHEELRGHAEIVRGGRHINWKIEELENPRGRGRNVQATSGSTGRRFTTAVSNQFLRYREGHEMLELENMNLRGRARVVVGAILPSAWPLRRQVTWGRLGVPVNRWFAPGQAGLSYRALTKGIVTQIKLLGANARYPEYLPPNDFAPVAEALAQFRAEGRPAYVRTMVSMATRVAAAARARGLDIRDTVFSVSGEALSPAKRAIIEDAGARVYPCYVATEFGTFGYACPAMDQGDSVHLFEDWMLLLPFRLADRESPSLFITNQLPWASRILINVGIDDCAVIEKSQCDCAYQRIGYTMRARDIFSYGKVTSQGITIWAADLVELLEAVLPARFGGAPGDYQLAEVEGAAQSEMLLRVSPRTGVTDTAALRDFFLESLGGILGGSLSQRLWSFSGGLRVSLEEPESTSTGKVHALRLRGPAQAPARV
jgi:hypothetical protein